MFNFNYELKVTNNFLGKNSVKLCETLCNNLYEKTRRNYKTEKNFVRKLKLKLV
jgi:hypothetical protein